MCPRDIVRTQHKVFIKKLYTPSRVNFTALSEFIACLKHFYLVVEANITEIFVIIKFIILRGKYHRASVAALIK